jgi:hypothetical protein
MVNATTDFSRRTAIPPIEASAQTTLPTPTPVSLLCKFTRSIANHHLIYCFVLFVNSRVSWEDVRSLCGRPEGDTDFQIGAAPIDVHPQETACPT